MGKAGMDRGRKGVGIKIEGGKGGRWKGQGLGRGKEDWQLGRRKEGEMKRPSACG